jgi:hypothetical protein
VAEVIEHLPSKCKALSSNPSTAKKKNPRIKEKIRKLQGFFFSLQALSVH